MSEASRCCSCLYPIPYGAPCFESSVWRGSLCASCSDSWSPVIFTLPNKEKTLQYREELWARNVRQRLAIRIRALAATIEL